MEATSLVDHIFLMHTSGNKEERALYAANMLTLGKYCFDSHPQPPPMHR